MAATMREAYGRDHGRPVPRGPARRHRARRDQPRPAARRLPPRPRARRQRRHRGAGHGRRRRRLRARGLPPHRALARAVHGRAPVRAAQARLRLPGPRRDLRRRGRLVRLRQRGRHAPRRRRRRRAARHPAHAGAGARPRRPRSSSCCGRRTPTAGRPTSARAWRRTSTATTSRPGGCEVLRRGAGPTVVAFGPMLDRTLAAVEGLDATVAYATSRRAVRRRAASRRWPARSRTSWSSSRGTRAAPRAP